MRQPLQRRSTASQDGDQFADDLLQLLGAGNPSYSPPLGDGVNQSLFPGQRQPSLPLQIPGWPASKGAGGITGPPIETGATLPYRDSRSSAFPQQRPAAIGTSRSVTSGARHNQSALAQPDAHPSTAPQPTIPALDAAHMREQIPSATHTGAQQPPHAKQAEAQLTSSEQGMPKRAGHHSMMSQPSPSILLTPRHSTAQAGSPRLHTAASPFQHFMLTGINPAGPMSLPQDSAPLSQPLDSLTSTSGGMQPSFNPLADASQPDNAPALDADQPESPVIKVQPEPDPQQHYVKHSSSSSDVKAAMPEFPTAQPPRSLQAQALRFVPDGGAPHEIKSEGYDGFAGEDDSAHTWANAKRSRNTMSGPHGAVTHDLAGMPSKKSKGHEGGGGHKGQPMSEAERRKIRRRVTNRESAKRIRDKRDEQMAQMSEQVAQLEAHKAALVNHMHSMENCCGQLTSQLKELKQKWCATCVENVKLYRKIFELRKALNPGTADSQLASRLALEDELASEATTAPVGDAPVDPANNQLVHQ